MKNRWKHIFIPVLAMALCLSLAACGNSDDVAGEDWRTTGVVVGSGTITHDSESVDVLVTADPNSAAFYRDQEEQVLFDSVAFPETIEDISSSAFQISFDDQNGDEESDVLVEIGHEDMSNTTMLWLWDPQERYVYQPDYSSFHVPGVAGPEELIASLVKKAWYMQTGAPLTAVPRMGEASALFTIPMLCWQTAHSIIWNVRPLPAGAVSLASLETILLRITAIIKSGSVTSEADLCCWGSLSRIRWAAHITRKRE